MNQPKTYQEWRRLWHQLASTLGRVVSYDVQNGRPPMMTKDLWKLCDQMRRVKLRMEAEAGAFTWSYAEAYLVALFSED